MNEIRNFLEHELAAIEWTNKAPVAGVFNIWSLVHGQIYGCQKFLNQIPNPDDGQLEALTDRLLQAFRRHRIPLSSSPFSKLLDDLREESPLVAIAALGAWLNAPGINVSNFDHIRGMFYAAAFDAKITPKTPSVVKRGLEDLQAGFQIKIAEATQQVLRQQGDYAEQRAKQRSAIARSILQNRNVIRAFRTLKQEQAEAAINSLCDTEKLYKEHMKLKGPVEYWSAKAQTHRSNAKHYRIILSWFAGIAGTLLIGALSYIALHAIQIATADKPPAVYLVLVTIGIVISTMVFWAARILTRLYLSEHHLAIDSDERSVMAQTYLALTAEGQATEHERAIVLSSLFRPTADGIVKDDGAPDISPASLLSRFGSK